MGDLRVHTLAVKVGHDQRKGAGARTHEPATDDAAPEPVVEDTEADTTLHQPAAASQH